MDKRAEIEISASAARLPAGLRSALRMVQDWAGNAKALLAKLHLAPKESEKRNWVGHAAGQVVGNLATRGIDLIVDQGKAVFEFNDKLVRLGIATKQTPAQLEAIGKAARATAVDIGIDAREVLAAGRAYGDLAGAENFTIAKMNLLSRAAQASEASTTDLAGMMYQLTRSMKVTDSQMEDTMGGLIQQAKDGAIEAKQMSKEFGAILPLYAEFGVLGREGAIQAGAMFQVIRDGYNSADEAGTGMVRILSGLRSHASRFEKAGVKIWNIDKDGTRHARSFGEIFKDIANSKVFKDPELLKKAFGRTEAWRGVELLLKAGERLLQLEASGRVNGVIMKDLGEYTSSAAGRIAVAFEKMKNAVAEAFTPERIEKFVGALERGVDKVAAIAEGVGKLGDAIAAFYGAGKAIRGGLTPGESRHSAVTVAEVQRRAAEKGIDDIEAYRQLAEEESAYKLARNRIVAATKDDKSTPESNRIAIEAANVADSTPGALGIRTAGEDYLNEAGLSAAEIRRQRAKISQDKLDSDIAAGRGRSSISPDMTASFLEALKQGAPAIGRSVASAIQAGPTPVLHFDGNPAAKAVKNATDRRRRP